MRTNFIRLSLLAATLAALPGCQIWNGWLDALKWKVDDKAPAQPQPLHIASPSEPIPMLSAPPALIPRVTVYRISLPVGTFTANDKIWAELNEDAIDSKTAVMMAQNGLRAATGALARWPVIAKVLDVP